MRRYRKARGQPALVCPDLPSQEDFEKAYERLLLKKAFRAKEKYYASSRFGEIPREELWKLIADVYKSRSFKDKEWCRSMLSNFGFNK